MPTTTVSISEAKQRLGEIADRAIEGEHIVIVRKSKLLVLKPLELPEPVPMRPPGYFNDCYDRESKKHEVILNAADGLDWKTAVRCDVIYLLPKAEFRERRGKVSPLHRVAIARKIVETFRLPMT